MPTTINDLPYEILSTILHEAVELNLQDAPKYSYGFNGMRSTSLSYGVRLRAHKSPDTLRWITTDAIRKVNRIWHDWACEYSLESVYLSRWRGSERWLESRSLADPGVKPSGVAVYRDPYCSLKKTLYLFENYHRLASCARRIWFDGYYGVETNAMIFNILRQCNSLQYVTLPWTSLRHSSAKDWSYVCGRNQFGNTLESLELLAVDLKEAQMANPANQVDKKAFTSTAVDFSRLKRLKIYGSTNFMPITDVDLQRMARTAKNLREIHIVRTTAVTLSGVFSLIDASHASLQFVDYSPQAETGRQAPAPLFLSRTMIKALFAGKSSSSTGSGEWEKDMVSMLPLSNPNFFKDCLVD